MNSISFVGNLTADPKVFVASNGKKRTTFSVAVNEGQGDEKKTHFVDCTAFGTLGENAADSLRKGLRVIVVGSLNSYPKEVEIDGETKRLTMVTFRVNAVGPDLRYATAKVSKVTRDATPNHDDEDEDDEPSSGKGSAGGGSSRAASADDDEEEEPPKAKAKRATAEQSDDF